MRITLLCPRVLLAASLLAIASCSDSSGPGINGGGDTRPPAELNILRLAPSSPLLLNPVDSFYAKKGENREIRIFFADIEGGQGEEYLRLGIDNESLLARPDGTPFAEGDSILIHVSVVDPDRLLFQMEPSGLTFSSDKPARLKIHYGHSGDDLNDDGKVDGQDDSIESTLSIWRQETPSDPFIRLGSIRSQDLREIDADLQGFSRYALAY